MAIPTLLNDDGSASIATAVMMSHHGFRRDLVRFAVGLKSLAKNERDPRITALREEWTHFKGALHGHHEAEDKGLFPHLAGAHPDVRATLDALGADHHRIDPLLEQGDRAFAELPATQAADAVITELATLLRPHLALEEEKLIPLLRGAKDFPPPSAAEIDIFAQGFAWACHGIAPAVLERVNEMLPAELVAKLPAAIAAFDARCNRVWGPFTPACATTPLPEIWSAHFER